MVTLPQGCPSGVAKTFLELRCHLRLSLHAPSSPEASPAHGPKALTPFFSSSHSLSFIGVSPNKSLAHLIPACFYFLVDLNNTPDILERCIPQHPLPEWCHTPGSSIDKSDMHQPI